MFQPNGIFQASPLTTVTVAVAEDMVVVVVVEVAMVAMAKKVLMAKVVTLKQAEWNKLTSEQQAEVHKKCKKV